MPRIFLVILLFCSYHFGSSQSFLYLKKLTGKQSVVYKTGDEILFQLKGDDHFSQGIIESFGEDYFVIHETEIKLTDIYRYDVRGLTGDHFNYQVSSNTLLVAAGLLPLAELANQQVSGSGDDTGIHHSVWVTSASLIAGGLIIKWMEPRYFKPSWKRKATIITK